MNLLLLDETEVVGTTARIDGRRVQHIQTILKKVPGDSLRAGVARKGFCTATLQLLDNGVAELHLGQLSFIAPPSVHIILALPRPKALSRTLAAAASFGVQSITLVNAWKVEKSYFSSPRLAPERLAYDVRLGCEQGAQAWVPEVRLIERFVPFVREETPRLFPDATKLVLHPHAEATLDQLVGSAARSADENIVIALGPEGGFVPQELQSLQDSGFSVARIDTGPLKTEVALAATLGQLALLRPSNNNRTEQRTT